MVGFVFCLSILLLLNINITLSVLFAAIVALKLFEENFRGTFTRIGHVLLTQPFPPHSRSILQSKSETIVMPLAVGLISTILLTYQWLWGSEIMGLCLVALTVFGTSLFVLHKTKPNYILALKKAISNRDFLQTTPMPVSREDLLLIKNSLESPYPDEVVFALNNLLKISLKHFKELIPELLKKGPSHNQKFVIDAIQSHNWSEFSSSLLELIQNPSTSQTIKQQAILTLSKVNLTALEPLLNNLLNTEEPLLQNAAVFVSIRYFKNQKIAKDALAVLAKMLNSPNPEHRTAIAHIVGDLEQEMANHAEVLDKILKDEDTKVRKTAIESIIRAEKEQYARLILENMEQVPFSYKTLKSIARLGPSIVPIIQSHFKNAHFELQVRQLQLLQFVSSPDALSFLQKIALAHNNKHQLLALQLLSRNQQFENEANLIIDVRPILAQETRALRTLIHQYKLLPKAELFSFLKNILERKMQLGSEKLLYALSLQEKNYNIIKALDSLK